MQIPKTIDAFKFVRSHGQLAGRVTPEDLGRLAELGAMTSGLEFELRGMLDQNGRPLLRLQVSGTIHLECQRCLGTVDHLLNVQSDLLLTGRMEEIEQADDADDRIFAGELLRLSDLVEDEAILGLPMIAKHENCGIAATGIE